VVPSAVLLEELHVAIVAVSVCSAAASALHLQATLCVLSSIDVGGDVASAAEICAASRSASSRSYRSLSCAMVLSKGARNWSRSR
jgi:hypothetical protein